MALIDELGLETHDQYLTGRKFVQIGKDYSIRSYTSDIPTLSVLGLLDLDRTMKKVYEPISGKIKFTTQSGTFNHLKKKPFENIV